MPEFSKINSDFLIIGGGILGAATACYLARLAPSGTRIRVIESAFTATGTTSQAAALLTRVRPDPGMADLVAETFAAIEYLNPYLDSPLPLRRVGSLHVAAAGQQYLDETAATAQRLQLEHQWLSSYEASLQAPWLCQSAVERALYVAEDGYLDPAILAQAFMTRARQLGVELEQQTAITGFITEAGKVVGAHSETTEYRAETTLCCAGPWSVALLAQLDIALAMAPVRSSYWITEDSDQFPANSPMVIMPDANAYARPEVGGLLFGLRDKQAVYGDAATLPADLQGYLFNCDPEGLECLEAGYEELQLLFPALETLGLRHYISGISSYTPDGKPLLGQTAVEGLLVASGCSGSGIAMSGGIGRFMAEAALQQAPFTSAEPFMIDRFGDVDPFSEQFRERCALTRTNKSSG